MTTVQEIEKSVEFLPEPELGKFRSWFEEFDSNAWDKQFEEDAKNGTLDCLADQALSDFADGRCTAL